MEDHYPYPIPTCQAEVPFLVEDLIFCSKVNNYSLHQFQSFCTSLSSKEIPFLVEELQFCSKVGPWPKCPTNYPSVNQAYFENNKRKLDIIDEELSTKRSEISLGRFASSRSRYDKNSAAYRCKMCTSWPLFSEI